MGQLHSTCTQPHRVEQARLGRVASLRELVPAPFIAAELFSVWVSEVHSWLRLGLGSDVRGLRLCGRGVVRAEEALPTPRALVFHGGRRRGCCSGGGGGSGCRGVAVQSEFESTLFETRKSHFRTTLCELGGEVPLELQAAARVQGLEPGTSSSQGQLESPCAAPHRGGGGGFTPGLLRHRNGRRRQSGRRRRLGGFLLRVATDLAPGELRDVAVQVEFEKAKA
jgi:hypothetical protein